MLWCYIFFPGLFFIIFSYFGSFMVVWGFGVGVFSWWGLGPVVWALLGFLGWGSLYKHKRITLGKKWCWCGRVKVKNYLRQCAVVILRANTITPSVCLKLTNYPCWVLTIEPIIQVIISGEWQLFTGSTHRILGTTTGGKGSKLSSMPALDLQSSICYSHCTHI